jgi:hypothetical protein
VRVGTLEPGPDVAAARAVPAAPPAGAPSAGRAPTVVDLARVGVRDYDPEGDGGEQGGEVANAYDGDPATSWRTDRYRTAAFGGLKQGVGLLVDLGRPTRLSLVDVAATRAGARFEVRAGDALGALRTVATGDGVRPRMTPQAGVRARYWVLWVTGLPRDGEGFRAGVRELRLLRVG